MTRIEPARSSKTILIQQDYSVCLTAKGHQHGTGRHEVRKPRQTPLNRPLLDPAVEGCVLTNPDQDGNRYPAKDKSTQGHAEWWGVCELMMGNVQKNDIRPFASLDYNLLVNYVQRKVQLKTSRKISSPFAWLRTREFEGTLHLGPELGVWGVNYYRVLKFIGELQDKTGNELKIEWSTESPPSQRDKDKGLVRTRFYRRVYSIDDCRSCFLENLAPSVSFLVSEKWKNAVGGRLDFDQEDDEIVGGHTMAIVPNQLPIPCPLNWNSDEFITAINSWGQKWGNRGFAAIHRDFFNRYMYDGWAAATNNNAAHIFSQELTGMVYLIQLIHESRIRQDFLIECIELDSNTCVGWAICSAMRQRLFVEDLFVWPTYRRRGIATKLMGLIRKLPNANDPCFFVPYADVEAVDQLTAVKNLFADNQLNLHNCDYRIAAYQATIDELSELKPLIFPPKPAYVFAPTAVVDSPIDELEKAVGDAREIDPSFRDLTKKVLADYSDILARLAK